MKERIRPLAICVFQDGDRILVADGLDSVKSEQFYRPLGGAIKFGEDSRETVARELREEIGAEVEGLRYLGAIENRFIYEGKPGHEIVLVYDGAFADRSLYARGRIEGIEEGNQEFNCVWVKLDDLRSGSPPLYPSGLLELLTGKNQR